MAVAGIESRPGEDHDLSTREGKVKGGGLARHAHLDHEGGSGSLRGISIHQSVDDDEAITISWMGIVDHDLEANLVIARHGPFLDDGSGAGWYGKLGRPRQGRIGQEG